MAKRNEILKTTFSDDGQTLTLQIIGFAPRVVHIDSMPDNVKKFWRNFGARQTLTNVIAPRKENGWSDGECDRRLGMKIDSFRAGNVESDKSPIRNWEDLFRAIAELKGRDPNDIRALTLPMEKWIALSVDKRVVAKMAEYEHARAQSALTDDMIGALDALE